MLTCQIVSMVEQNPGFLAPNGPPLLTPILSSGLNTQLPKKKLTSPFCEVIHYLHAILPSPDRHVALTWD